MTDLLILWVPIVVVIGWGVLVIRSAWKRAGEREKHHEL